MRTTLTPPWVASAIHSMSFYATIALSMAVLALAFWGFFKTLSLPWMGISISRPTAQIVEVESNSLNIGRVFVGDEILSIGNVPLNDAHPLYGDAEIGETVPIVIKRGTNAFTVDLAVEAPSQEIYLSRVIHHFTAFIFWLLGIALFIRHPLERRSQVFLLMCLCVTVILALLNPLMYQEPNAPREIYNLGLWLFGATFVHLHTLFPVAKTSHFWRIVVGVFYAISIGVILSYNTNTAGTVPVLTNTIANVSLVASLVLGLVLLTDAWRIGDGPVHRRVRVLVFGTMLAALPVIILVALSNYFVVPSFNIALLGLVAFPATYAYVLQKEDLVTTDLLLYRVLLYVLLSIVLIIAYLLILQILGYVHPMLHATPLTGSVVSLVIAFLFSPTREAVDRVLNRLFYGVGYNYLQVLNPAVRKMADLKQESVLEVLTKDVTTVLGVANAGVWISAPNGDFEKLGGSLASKELEIVLSTSQWKNHLAKYPDEPLLVNQEDILSENFNSLKSSTTIPVRWAVPLVLSNELHGVWLLGPRIKDESYSPIDQRLIALTAQTAAFVLKVSSLLHQLQRQLEINLADHNEMISAYRQLTHVRENERQSLAQELHDGLLQTLITLDIPLKRVKTTSPEVQEIVQQIEDRLHKMVIDLRVICQGLRPPALTTNGLRSGIRALAGEVKEVYGLEVDLSLQVPENLPSDWELHLYRIVQESLMNIVKHAKVSTACVSMVTDNHHLYLHISDNGKGFDPTSVQGQRFGLVGLRERARALGGDMTIFSLPGQGTSIETTIALPQEQGASK